MPRIGLHHAAAGTMRIGSSAGQFYVRADGIVDLPPLHGGRLVIRRPRRVVVCRPPVDRLDVYQMPT